MKFTYKFISTNSLEYSAVIDFTNHPPLLTVYSRRNDIFCTVAKLQNETNVYTAHNFVSGEDFIIHVYPTHRMTGVRECSFHVIQKTYSTLLATLEKKE